jgi:deoxyribodipyrimidine photo-lyase
MQKINIFWFRRDLRLNDNHGLSVALKSGLPVLPVFIFDPNILSNLEENDSRITFIHDSVLSLKIELEKIGSSIKVFHESPVKVFESLTMEFSIHAVYTNHDYEPYATERDKTIENLLASKGTKFISFKDHVIFEKDEIIKDDGLPYTVFTPYSRRWKQKFSGIPDEPFRSELYGNAYLKTEKFGLPSLESIGFQRSEIIVPPPVISVEIIREYEKTRDFPSLIGTSRLGIHLRFGTISIRQLVSIAQQESEVFLNELIWREFFSQILWHFPHVVDSPFRKAYSFIEWRNDEGEFARWCRGETGYPIVDAGMRELNTTGFMHNRVRMGTASFLVKHLLIDWRWGEAYFASNLFDYELASNNGNWQWAAGTGCDAAPYFRIFNPENQQKKFDPNEMYIRKWIPELETKFYPEPMVEHSFARERALAAFKKALAMK